MAGVAATVAVIMLTPEALARPDGRGAGCDKPVFLSIGLAGNGMVAMTILYSLRPA
jgi:hypothetical protein